MQVSRDVDTVNDEPYEDAQNVIAVHHRLRRAILQGEIGPGEPTSQVALGERFGVGRTPLREALRMLEREGLVVSHANRSFRVAQFSIADIEGVYAMRIALEAVGIRATVPVLDDEDFAELEGLMAQMDHYIRARDQIRLDGPHSRFHARFVRAGGIRLTTTANELFDYAARYRLAYGTANLAAGYEDRRAEHRAMVDAAATGDSDLTVERMVEHYTHTAAGVISVIDADHEPTVLRAAIAAVAPSLADSSALAIPSSPTAEQAPEP